QGRPRAVASARLLPEPFKPLAEPLGPHLRGLILLPVGRVQHCKVAIDACLDLFHPAADRAGRVVPDPRIPRLEAAAVESHRAAGNEPQFPAQHTNWWHMARIASPLSRRKSAIVLKSGTSLPTHPLT